MFIDTHCHLDAVEFDADRDEVAASARQVGVDWIVVPAVERANFGAVAAVCRDYPGCVPAWGIHPMFVNQAQEEDLAALRGMLENNAAVAIGEIGLDAFKPDSDEQRQKFFFIEQLKIAREFDLPVLLHSRRAVEAVIQLLRHNPVRGGVAHAFNGSFVQAEEFIKLGFKLGFGGGMTLPRATHLRELAAKLPLESIVLETDAPDIPPAWLRADGESGRNTPAQLPRIAAILAELRGLDINEVARQTSLNALAVMPRLKARQ